MADLNPTCIDQTTGQLHVTSPTDTLISKGLISCPDSSNLNSERFGAGTTANAVGALAVGNSAVASGINSIAIGLGASATGPDISVNKGKIAIGASAISSGDRTVAIGVGAQALNDESVAIGPEAWANNAQGGGSSEFPSTAVGDGCKAGPDPSATPAGNRQAWLAAFGAYSEAGIGLGANADCIAVGNSSTAGGSAPADLQTYSDCIAIGDNNRAGSTRAVIYIKTASNLSGATFTITVGGTPVTLTDGVDFTHSNSNTTETNNLTNAINANVTLSASLTASNNSWFNGWRRIELKFKSTVLVGTTLTVATSAASGDALAVDAFNSSNQIAIGNAAYASGNGLGVAIGIDVRAGIQPTDTNNIGIGQRIMVGGSNAIVLGRGLSGGGGPAANLDSSFNYINNAFVAGSSNFPITDVWFGSGPSGSGSSLANTGYTIHGPDGRSGFPNAATITIAGGRGFTATDSASNVIIKTGQTGVATTLINRMIVNSVAKALTSAVLTSLIQITLPSNSMAGGRIKWVVRATDGTDFQAISGITTYSAVNAGGTITSTAVNNTGNDASTVPVGTLTTAWSTTNGVGTVNVQVTATSSLTTTTFDIQYQVENDSTVDITIL